MLVVPMQWNVVASRPSTGESAVGLARSARRTMLYYHGKRARKDSWPGVHLPETQ